MRIYAPAAEIFFCGRGYFIFHLLLFVLPASLWAQPGDAADAHIAVTQVQQDCRQPARLTLTLRICNSGSRPLPRAIPVSFYTSDPRLPGAARYAGTWSTTAVIGPGVCRSFQISREVSDARTDSFYAVVNDNGRSSPFRLPNTGIREENYQNNITLANGFRFRARILSQKDSLERGDSVRLSIKVRNGVLGTLTWSSPPGLSCTDCISPTLHILKNDSAKKLIAVSRAGCRDTAFTDFYIRPQADYAVRIDSIVCGGYGRGNVHFQVCDNSATGSLPDSLPVSFYQGDPSAGKLIGKPFILHSQGKAACVADSILLEHLFAGSITAVVHDTLLPAEYRFPAGGHFDEDILKNNIDIFNYQSPAMRILPADTVVFRGSLVPLRWQSDLSGIVATEWLAAPGATLDCDRCPAPVCRVSANAEMRARVRTAYGCAVEAKANLHIFPPDFTGSLLESLCYKNDSLLVRFRLCMNNGYDTVPAGIPVTFSGRSQTGGPITQLTPVFFTPKAIPGGCADYQIAILSPPDSMLYMKVNDGGSLPPSQIHISEETNWENNTCFMQIVPYRISFIPGDTVIYRGNELRLAPSISGGKPQWFKWQPELFLSCSGCVAPMAKPQYDISYLFTASTVLGCTDSARIRIRTVAGSRINIPNAFSPNGDGRNDVFYITGRPDLTMIKHFSIFNRNGERVLERHSVAPNDPGYGWDGNFHGAQAPAGTYLFFVTVAFSDGSEEQRNGTLVLLR